jgi:hypothetical protein
MHVEPRKLYSRQWYLNNRDKVIALQLKYHATPGYAERKRKYDAERYRRIRARKLADDKRWRESHIEQQNMFSRRRRVRKLFLGGHHSVEEWFNVKAAFGNACANCGMPESEAHCIKIQAGGLAFVARSVEEVERQLAM